MNDKLIEAMEQLIQYNVCMCEGGDSYDPLMADYHVQRAREILTAALAASKPKPQAEVRVPDGYVMVPVEPTQEMVNAAMRECSGIGGGSCGEHTGVDGDDMRSVFFAMLSAAPNPQDDLPAILKKQAS